MPPSCGSWVEDWIPSTVFRSGALVEVKTQLDPQINLLMVLSQMDFGKWGTWKWGLIGVVDYYCTSVGRILHWPLPLFSLLPGCHGVVVGG